MQHFAQSPTDPDFVQNPYPFYDRARRGGDLFWWDDYALPCATSHPAVTALLKDRRLGREAPPEHAPAVVPHTAPFYAVEAHSMLELEPPRHTRLRSLVLRAFTSRRIAGLAPEIEGLCHTLIDRFPAAPFDLLEYYARIVPVIIIARLLGVPESRADDLLAWSNAMVGMYQARRTRADEEAASRAATDFTAFLTDYITQKRKQPADDLITTLIAAEEDGQRLSEAELITTCILLLNAGHEATVHTLGNGVKTLLETGYSQSPVTGELVEEIIRFDPPLHMFTRWIYEDCTLFGHDFRRGDRVACLLAAANRDPAAYPDPARFDPARDGPANTAFGAGIHFCVGAPLARLELRIALHTLFARHPHLRLAAPPAYADVYHFHGLQSLMVTTA
jgi:cytochrome P450